MDCCFFLWQSIYQFGKHLRILVDRLNNCDYTSNVIIAVYYSADGSYFVFI